MRRALIAFLVAGCTAPPSYEGRQCNGLKPCPVPFSCVAERCRLEPAEPDGGGTDASAAETDASAAETDAGGSEKDAGDAGDPSTDASLPDATPEACPGEVTESAWTVRYYALDLNDEIDRSSCYGTEQRSNLVITGDPALVAGLTQYAVVAVRNVVFPGSSRIDVEYGDGLRLYVDGILRLDDWNEHAESVDDDVRLYLPPTAPHPVVVEKLTKAGERVLEVDIDSRCGGSVVGPNLWHAVYYAVIPGAGTWTLDRGHCLGTAVLNTTTLAEVGTPAVVSALGITTLWGADYRAQRNFAAPTTVTLVHDDGLRVFDGGAVIYDTWIAPNVTDTTLTVGAGNHDFHLEYFQELGGAQVQFTY